MTSPPDLPVNFTLDTDRCRLRHVTAEDIPHVFSATRYAGFNDGMLWDPPENDDELLAPHQRNVEAWRNSSYYCFTVEHHESREFLGRIVIVPDSASGWNLGFWTHPLHQGQGYMTEAAGRILQFLFQKTDAQRVSACHAVWNVASRRVLEKIGMRFVEHLPQGFKKRGEWVPEDRLAVSREEWSRSRQTHPHSRHSGNPGA